MSNEAQGKDSMKIYLVFIRVHTLDLKNWLSELVWSPSVSQRDALLHFFSEFLFVTHTQK